MKNKLFLFITILTLAAAIFTPARVKASHGAGGEIIYQHISDSTYRVIFKFYRDCRGPAAPVNQRLCVYNSCSGTTDDYPMDTVDGYGPNQHRQVSAGCSAYPSRCIDPSSPLPGFEEYWYSKVIIMPFRCNSWRFYTYIQNRNASLNILNSSSLYFYVETTFDNTIGGIYNNIDSSESSPYFSIKPLPYLCINQPYSYNNGAIDPNGDSIVTEMVMPMQLSGTCGSTQSNTTFATTTGSAYNLTNNPLQTSNTFSINPATGQMNFTASALGEYTLTTRVTQYRRGRVIGHIMRDILVVVINCTSITPTFIIDQTTVRNAVWRSNRIEGCINQKMEFCYDVKSSDTNAVLILEDNHFASVPNAAITYTNQFSDSVRGCFSWTPGATESGLRTLIVVTKDSTCKPPGIMLFYSNSIPIYVWPAVKTVADTAVCPGETAYLNATGGGNYQWSVLPGGDPITSLNNPSIPNPVALPNINTTYVVTSTSNTFCNNNTDTVTVNVLPGLNFEKLRDTITCPDNPVTLDLKINPPAGSTYTMKWTPSTYLSDSTSSKPVATPKNSITYTVLLTSTLNKCKGRDTVFVDVLKGFTIDNPDTAICDGQKVQVRITGDNRYSYKWTTSSTSPGVFSNADIADPIITPSNLGKFKYIVNASFPKCKDSTAEFTIDMQPVPIVKVDADAIICYGDTMQLKGIVTPGNYPFKYSWTPGASLSNPAIINPIFSATETTELTLTASTPAGCQSSDKIKLTVVPSTFLFPSNDTAICPGSKVQLHLTGNGIRSFRWYPDVRISDKLAYDPYIWPSGTQTYTVYGIDTNSCADTAYVKVAVYPHAMLSLPDSVRIYPGQAYQVDPQANAAYYSWFPAIGLSKTNIANPVARPDVNTRYYVTATTEAGCTTTDSISVLVSPITLLDVPNAFTPGTSANNTLKVVRLGEATLKNFSIYNRWGIKVFETADINTGWDGMYKGVQQPMGVYMYTVEAVTLTGKPFNKQGNITLIR